MNNPMQQAPPPIQDPNQQENDQRAHNINARWKAISYIYTFAALGLACYWEFRDVPAGLNRYIYEFQLSILTDSYYPALDVMVTLLIFIIPLLVVKVVVEKVTGVKIQGLRGK